jgi:hypothetical protein
LSTGAREVGGDFRSGAWPRGEHHHGATDTAPCAKRAKVKGERRTGGVTREWASGTREAFLPLGSGLGRGFFASRAAAVQPAAKTGRAMPNPACRGGGPNTARRSGRAGPGTVENGSGWVGTGLKSCQASGLAGGPYRLDIYRFVLFNIFLWSM